MYIKSQSPRARPDPTRAKPCPRVNNRSHALVHEATLELVIPLITSHPPAPFSSPPTLTPPSLPHLSSSANPRSSRTPRRSPGVNTHTWTSFYLTSLPSPSARQDAYFFFLDIWYRLLSTSVSPLLLEGLFSCLRIILIYFLHICFYYLDTWSWLFVLSDSPLRP